METTVAVLMVVGIFIGGPALIGFAIAGLYFYGGRRALRAERAKALAEAAAVVAEARREQLAGVGTEGAVE